MLYAGQRIHISHIVRVGGYVVNYAVSHIVISFLHGSDTIEALERQYVDLNLDSHIEDVGYQFGMDVQVGVSLGVRQDERIAGIQELFEDLNRRIFRGVQRELTQQLLAR